MSGARGWRSYANSTGIGSARGCMCIYTATSAERKQSGIF